jgi:hypothetical protein
LTLQAIADLTDSSSVNVNMMTHLEKKRVEYLLNSEMTFAEAKTQAQTEILKNVFNIENVSLGKSETLNISESGDGNAVLLAISTLLQHGNTEGELTELLANIINDIRTDGTVDTTATQNALKAQESGIDSNGGTVGPYTCGGSASNCGSTFRTNLEERYRIIGVSATIPAFESYIHKLWNVNW